MGNVEIKEVYRNYKPPVDVVDVIRTLLNYVPQSYLGTLRSIVLTNSSNLSRDRRHGKTKYRGENLRIAESLGLYHQQRQGSSAWIEIFVDNTLKMWPRLLLRIPPIRDMVFADVLYHELGHHIQQTISPEHHEKEDVAEKWKSKLRNLYIRKKYWYLLPILYPMVFVIRFAKKLGFFKRMRKVTSKR